MTSRPTQGCRHNRACHREFAGGHSQGKGSGAQLTRAGQPWIHATSQPQSRLQLQLNHSSVRQRLRPVGTVGLRPG
eukprot:1912805-Alexandrium_andersonii.AAC.1